MTFTVPVAVGVAFPDAFVVAFGAVVFTGVAVTSIVTGIATEVWVSFVTDVTVSTTVVAGVGVVVVFVPGVLVVQHPANRSPPTSTATRASSRAFFAIN